MPVCILCISHFCQVVFILFCLLSFSPFSYCLVSNFLSIFLRSDAFSTLPILFLCSFFWFLYFLKFLKPKWMMLQTYTFPSVMYHWMSHMSMFTLNNVRYTRNHKKLGPRRNMTLDGLSMQKKSFHVVVYNFVVLSSSTYLFCNFYLITLKHTPQSVGLLWTNDQPDADTSTWQHKHCTRQTSMPPVGFAPTIPASARPQTYALDQAATGIGFIDLYWRKFRVSFFCAVLVRNTYCCDKRLYSWHRHRHRKHLGLHASFWLELSDLNQNCKLAYQSWGR
jgi:hypothetical protein